MKQLRFLQPELSESVASLLDDLIVAMRHAAEQSATVQRVIRPEEQVQCQDSCRDTQLSCTLGNDMALRRSPLLPQAIHLVATSCELTMEHCLRHHGEECQRCAEACQQCANLCHEFLSAFTDGPVRPPYAAD